MEIKGSLATLLLQEVSGKAYLGWISGIDTEKGGDSSLLVGFNERLDILWGMIS